MVNRIRQWLRQARQVHRTPSTPTPTPHTVPTASTPQRPTPMRCGCAQPPLPPRNGVRVVITAHGINMWTEDGR